MTKWVRFSFTDIAYTRDHVGNSRLIQTADPLGKATTYVRDEAGNAWQITNRLNESTQVSYDVLNRPTRYDYLVDNSYQTTTYSIYGNVMAQANFSVSYSYTHDALNRLKTKTDSHGMYLKSLAFNYDKSGRILSKSTYQNTITSYTYDGTGHLAAITNPDYLTVNYQFDGAGRLLSRTMSSGAKSLYQYDANGQLLHLTHTAANGTTLTDIAYTRDKVGNILTQTDSTGTTTFTYDPLYRLTGADYPGTANDESFTYDEVGNRLTHTKGGTARYYNYLAQANRLSDIRLGSPTGTIESAFTFDDEGRLNGQTGVNARIPHWDAKGRLNALTAGGRTDVYLYDPADHRVGRTGPTTYYLEGEHLESVDTFGKTREKYFRGASIDELVAGYLPDSTSNLSPVLFQHDGTMSVVAISNPNGTTIQTSQYSAFGSTINSTGSSISRLKYTGREDDGTGLYYYRARYYDPTIGRFISEDPLGFQAGINFYAYVNNNPVNANDPTGLADWLKAGRSFVDMLSNGAGVVTGGVLTATGAGLLMAPEPTGITKAGGAFTLTTGLAGIANSGTGLVNSTRNLVRALQDNPANPGNLPTSGFGVIADTFFSGSQSAQNFATVGDLSLALLSGRVPVGTAQINTFSAFSQRVPVGINGMFDAGAVAVPSRMNGILLPSADSASSFASMALNGTQLGQLGTIAYDQASYYLGGSGSAAAGGFLLYPNKSNTNQMQSVYSK